MALLDVNWNPNRRELRQFSLIWIVFFGLIGAYSYWFRESPRTAGVLWSIASAGILGVVFPGAARPVYVVWMALALPIGWTISHLLLLFVYYVVVTPIGLIMRLVGYDPMQRQFDRAAKTYWIKHDAAGEPTRYFKQY